MADTPPDDTREKIVADWCPEINEPGRRTLLAEMDRVDPLRVLLANDGKAVALIDGALRSSRALVDYDAVAAVLAALREVAGL